MSQSVEIKTMQRWEYLIGRYNGEQWSVFAFDALARTYGSSLGMLAELGGEGWELCASVARRGEIEEMVFKRPCATLDPASTLTPNEVLSTVERLRDVVRGWPDRALRLECGKALLIARNSLREILDPPERTPARPCSQCRSYSCYEETCRESMPR